MSDAECQVVQSFLDSGGIVAVVFLFVLRDFLRIKFSRTQES